MNSGFLFTEARCSRERCWSPQADVYQCARGWLVKFDLAGVRPKDIAVSFDGSCLSVSGIRRDLFIEEGYSSYSIEISYSRFERSITLSDEIIPASVKTEYHDGMLLVWVTTERREA
jgi:HSP20 family molecular chaperone IbpA